MLHILIDGNCLNSPLSKLKSISYTEPMLKMLVLNKKFTWLRLIFETTSTKLSFRVVSAGQHRTVAEEQSVLLPAADEGDVFVDAPRHTSWLWLGAVLPPVQIHGLFELNTRTS